MQERTATRQESIEKIYSRYAPIYDATFGGIFEQGRARAVALLVLRPGERVLELGVGTGLLLPHYPAGVHVVGIDMSAKMLDHAERRIRELALPNVGVRRMDATRTEFPEDAFDKAVGAYFLSAAPDPKAVLCEAARVVKPGGVAVFLNHFRTEKPWPARIEKWLAPIGRTLGFTTTLDLRATFEGTPFRIERVEATNLFGYWKIVVCRNEKNKA